MIYRSNSSSKAGKQIIEVKASLETGCALCLQKLSYKSTEKLIKKDEARKPKLIFVNNFFQKSKQTYNKWITTKNDG